MKGISFIILSMLMLSLASSPAVGTNLWPFMTNAGPMMLFTDEDLELFDRALSDALNTQEDGAVHSWKNPATESHGAVTPLRTFDDSGTTCRRTKIVNNAGGKSATFVFNFCKQADNTWQIVVK